MVDKDLVDCKTWGLFSTAFHGWAKSKLHNDDMGNSKQFLTPAHFASCLHTPPPTNRTVFLFIYCSNYMPIFVHHFSPPPHHTHTLGCLLAKTHHHIRSSCVLLSISPMMHIHVLCTCWWCRLLFKYMYIYRRTIILTVRSVVLSCVVVVAPLSTENTSHKHAIPSRHNIEFIMMFWW